MGVLLITSVCTGIAFFVFGVRHIGPHKATFYADIIIYSSLIIYGFFRIFKILEKLKMKEE